MFKPMFVSDVVAKVWEAAINPLSAVNPPDEPASTPHENCPVVAFHTNFPDDGSQVVLSPAPNMYPEFKLRPVSTERPPAKVEVAELLTTIGLENVCIPPHVLDELVPKARDSVRSIDRSPPPWIGYVVFISRVVGTAVKPSAFCLLLNVVKSAEEIYPFEEVLA